MAVLLWILGGFAGLCGLGLVREGFRSLATVMARKSSLIRVKGNVIGISQVYSRSETRGSRRIAIYNFYPQVRFKTLEGEVREFRSELGDTGRTTGYKPGQGVDVWYDPEGTLGPMLASGWALWGIPIMLIFGGLVFLAFSVGVGYVYWTGMLPKK